MSVGLALLDIEVSMIVHDGDYAHALEAARSRYVRPNACAKALCKNAGRQVLDVSEPFSALAIGLGVPSNQAISAARKTSSGSGSASRREALEPLEQQPIGRRPGVHELFALNNRVQATKVA